MVVQNSPLKSQKALSIIQVLLRALAFATTLSALWLMLTSRQSTEVFAVKFEAKYSYSPAFKFFAIANAVGCALSLLSAIPALILRRQSSNPGNFFFVFLLDLVAMTVVVAGCAAATAVGYVGRYGNSHTGWIPVCDHFEKFCDRLTVSVAFSYSALILFLLLTILSAHMSRRNHA